MSILAIFNSLASSVFADWNQRDYMNRAGVTPNSVVGQPQLPQTGVFPPAPRQMMEPQAGFPSQLPQEFQTPQESYPVSNEPQPQETFPVDEELIRSAYEPDMSKGGEIQPTYVDKTSEESIFDLETTGTDLDSFLGDKPFEGAGEYKTIREYLEKYKGKVGTIEYMTPGKYLDSISYQEPNEDKIKALKKKVKAGKKLHLPFLDYTVGEEVDQEGRNRAYLARRMGIEKIPVLVVNKSTPSKK